MPRLHRHLIYLFLVFNALYTLVQIRLILQDMEISVNLTRLQVFIGANLFAS